MGYIYFVTVLSACSFFFHICRLPISFPVPFSARLVDRHPTGEWRLLFVHLVRVGVLLLGILPLWSNQVLLEASPEVAHADEGIDDGEDDEDDGEDSERGQRASNRHVMHRFYRLVNADKLEEEIGKSAKVQEDNGAHADFRLPLGKQGGAEENRYRNGDGGDGQTQFDVGFSADDDEELDRETEEEEEIELQQGNVNLQIPPC